MGQKFIEGVTLTELRQINDVRGALLHMLRADAAEFTRFGECYFSEVFPGAIKAWKRHRLQTQNLAVPIGRVCVVIYDERANSATYNQVQVIELGRPDAYSRLKIPTGLWYGFSCISATSALIVNCTDLPHDSTEGEVCMMDDAKIPYQWTSSQQLKKS